MFVETLQLSNFRNYSSASVSFCDGLNVIYGQNARGKTNLLEAVYLLSTARSHRGAKEKEMILFGKEKAKIVASFYSHDRTNKGELSLFADRKKQIKINGVPLSKASLLMGYFNVVMFCPEELRLVKGGPKERRRMLDLGICQINRNYFHHLAQYARVLEQKNSLLREKPDSDMLWVWNEKLAESGSLIIWYRHQYLQKLQQKAKIVHHDACGETMELQYECGALIHEIEQKQAIREQFLLDIEKNTQREKRQGMALVGPHRDDFGILINQKNAKVYASQGQQRTIVLSLKMAEIQLIEQVVGEPPVLLLDDVLSELDEHRRNYILNHISGMQTIITCTEQQQFDKLERANQINVEEVRQ